MGAVGYFPFFCVILDRIQCGRVGASSFSLPDVPPPIVTTDPCCRAPQVIKKPMDLSLIRERIMSGALASLDDMSRDLFVMCNNAMVFNGAGDSYFDYSKVFFASLCLSVASSSLCV